MSPLPYLLAYAGIAVFVVAVVARVRMYARMPMQLRWELYPVPHDGERAAHGGSYLEEVDWWTKPRDVVKVYDLKAMATELLFLEALHRHNRPMWRSSYPFHAGIYLVTTSTVLMLTGSLLEHLAPRLMASAYGAFWQYSVTLTGAVGLAFSIYGAIGLLRRRLTSPELADFTTAADLFNLAFFVVAFGCAFLTFALFDRNFRLVGAFVHNLVTFRLEPVAGGPAGALLEVSVCLLAVLVAYIPLSRMSHFVGKYFAYHEVRWNDEPNLRGGPREAPIVANLTQKVSWAAPHIQSHGQKSWLEVATMDPETYGAQK